MSTQPEHPATLIGESFDSADARLYVYRDNGSGKVDGTYLRRYETRVEVDDLRRDLGPGLYILLQNRGPAGAPIRRRVLVPSDPDSSALEVEGASAGAAPYLSQLREIVAMKMIAEQLAPKREADPLKMLEAVLHLVRGTQPVDPLNAFLQGANWGGGSDDPASILAAAGARALERRVSPGDEEETESAPPSSLLPVLKRALSAIDGRLSKMERVIANLPKKGAPMVSVLEVFQVLLMGAYENGEAVASVLRVLDRASAGGVRSELASFTTQELKAHCGRALEEQGHGERLGPFMDGIAIFLKGEKA